ncbi:MAG TPA: GNAT family N-acetyltransferase [Acetobacteraceae bacterium]|jgi:GNAT superfamily N-acetyltransferase|nr:GNAT family N-acetyltransferase [Acetobacteraceae bacterium]
MVEPILVVTDVADDETYRIVNDGLAGHGVEQAGYWDSRPLYVNVQDASDQRILGGIVGRTSLGLMFIELVFLPEELRNRGLGTRMLQMAEQEAVRRGCCAGVLYTISFQAPAFYQRHGWREFGRVACHPPGTSRIFMTKDLPRAE